MRSDEFDESPLISQESVDNEEERVRCSRQGRWNCGGCVKTSLGGWERLPGSKWPEILKLGNPLEKQEEGNWHNVLTQRLFGIEVSSGAPPADLGPLVDGQVHALDTLQMAAAAAPSAFSNLNIATRQVEDEMAQWLSLLLDWGGSSKSLDELRRVAVSIGSLTSWSTSLLCPPSPFLHTWLEVRWCLLQLAKKDIGLDFGLLTPSTFPCHTLLAATLIDLLHLSR